VNGALDAHAVGDFLADPREDQHVGVHRHAHGQHDAGDARQGQGRAEQRHQRQQHHHVEAQGNVGQQAEGLVDGHHEQRDQQEAPQRRLHAQLDVLGTQARADGAFLGKVHRRGQATGAQQQGQLGGFARTVEAGDAEAVAQRRLDGRQADHLALFPEGGDRHFLLDAIDRLADVAGHRLLLDEHHRHAAADVVAGGAAHQLATVTVETDVDLRAAVLVEAGLGVGHLVAGDDHPALQLHGGAALLAELEGLGAGARGVQLGGQAEFQVGGLAEDALGFGGVLHAGQFDDDAVGALALHQRLGHAQLVDPVAHGGEVLLDRVFANLDQLGLGQVQAQDLQAVALQFLQLEIGEVLADQAAGLLKQRAVGKAKLDRAVLLGQRAVTHALLAQQALDLAFVDLQTRIDSLVHVHFKEEMHAAGEVETEFHRAGAEAAQPVGRGRREVQGHHIVVTEGAAHHVLGRQLVFLALQAQQAALLGRTDRLDRDACLAQRALGALDIGRADLQRGTGATELDGRIVRVEVGRGIDEADPQHHEDQQIFPQGILVEHDTARLRNGAPCVPRRW